MEDFNTTIQCYHGGTYKAANGTCACPAGFTGGDCGEDIDECWTKPYPCSPHSSCTNTLGSYVCTCNDGFIGDGYWCNVAVVKVEPPVGAFVGIGVGVLLLVLIGLLIYFRRKRLKASIQTNKTIQNRGGGGGWITATEALTDMSTGDSSAFHSDFADSFIEFGKRRKCSRMRRSTFGKGSRLEMQEAKPFLPAGDLSGKGERTHTLSLMESDIYEDALLDEGPYAVPDEVISERKESDLCDEGQYEELDKVRVVSGRKKSSHVGLQSKNRTLVPSKPKPTSPIPEYAAVNLARKTPKRHPDKNSASSRDRDGLGVKDDTVRKLNFSEDDLSTSESDDPPMLPEKNFDLLGVADVLSPKLQSRPADARQSNLTQTPEGKTAKRGLKHSTLMPKPSAGLTHPSPIPDRTTKTSGHTAVLQTSNSKTVERSRVGKEAGPQNTIEEEKQLVQPPAKVLKAKLKSERAETRPSNLMQTPDGKNAKGPYEVLEDPVTKTRPRSKVPPLVPPKPKLTMPPAHQTTASGKGLSTPISKANADQEPVHSTTMPNAVAKGAARALPTPQKPNVLSPKSHSERAETRLSNSLRNSDGKYAKGPNAVLEDPATKATPKSKVPPVVPPKPKLKSPPAHQTTGHGKETSTSISKTNAYQEPMHSTTTLNAGAKGAARALPTLQKPKVLSPKLHSERAETRPSNLMRTPDGKNAKGPFAPLEDPATKTKPKSKVPPAVPPKPKIKMPPAHQTDGRGKKISTPISKANFGEEPMHSTSMANASALRVKGALHTTKPSPIPEVATANLVLKTPEWKERQKDQRHGEVRRNQANLPSPSSNSDQNAVQLGALARDDVRDKYSSKSKKEMQTLSTSTHLKASASNQADTTSRAAASTATSKNGMKSGKPLTGDGGKSKSAAHPKLPKAAKAQHEKQTKNQH